MLAQQGSDIEPLGASDRPILVDEAIAPLITEMRGMAPCGACGDHEWTGDASFLFIDRQSALEFIGHLSDFARSDEFTVYYTAPEVCVAFPSDWIEGLTEHYRAYWEARDEEARASASHTKEAPERHTTVEINGIEIDEDLAPLIRLLWDAGVKTTMCWQERDPGICCIQFPSPPEALKFFISASSLVSECQWALDNQHDEGDDFEVNPIGCVSVGFPRAELGALTRRWNAANNKFYELQAGH